MTDDVLYFNPRSPCGERPARRHNRRKRCDFNPRSPCGERRDHRRRQTHGPEFQSTLPVWGATPAGRGLNPEERRFQSTLPVWGATTFRERMAAVKEFQSTLPVWGATSPAPPGPAGPPHFNPRSPCGERPGRCGGGCGGRNFNPRSPCGERRALLLRMFTMQKISIHAPRVGSDSRRRPTTSTSLEFQSTLPVWGATGAGSAGGRPPGISIHAPRVGSDAVKEAVCSVCGVFQSTLPVWGATRFGFSHPWSN